MLSAKASARFFAPSSPITLSTARNKWNPRDQSNANFTLLVALRGVQGKITGIPVFGRILEFFRAADEMLLFLPHTVCCIKRTLSREQKIIPIHHFCVVSLWIAVFLNMKRNSRWKFHGPLQGNAHAVIILMFRNIRVYVDTCSHRLVFQFLSSPLCYFYCNRP